MLRESIVQLGLACLLCAAAGDAAFAGDAVGDRDAPSRVSLSLRWQDEDSANVGGEADGQGFESDGVIEPAEDEIAELAKATQNPVADLISLPFQNNTYFQLGEHGRAANILNIQPVVPIDINDKWLLITRTILPVTYRPALFRGDSDEFGLGDLQFTAFFSPKGDSSFIWGVGPVLRFPTATDDSLGSEKWSAGPSFVALTMQGPWVAGGLVQNVWSY